MLPSKVLRHGRVLDETARRRFRTEALALSRLNHPNIATIHDFDSDAGIDFLVMEYIPGASLDERVREGSCSDAEVRHIGVQLAHGLRAAHERGVIHGDLKPGNLRLTPDGRLKILDFGLARLLRSVSSDEADRTRTLEMAGTVPYLAPERLHGGGIDIRTDIYAVGAVLYELASGQRLFGHARGSDLWSAILTQEPEAPRVCNSGISEPLDALIRTALAKDAMQRQQSAAELLRDLERLERNPAQPPPSGHRRRPRLIVLGGSDQRVRVLNAENYAEEMAWQAHATEGLKRQVLTVVFSPDGKRVLTAGADATARTYDAATGAELAVLRGHDGDVMSAAFSSNGWIVTTSSDRSVRLWTAFGTPQALIDYARAHMPRELTPAQRERYFLSPPAASSAAMPAQRP